jgi:aminoglycoside N3'-acetyltransferase
MTPTEMPKRSGVRRICGDGRTKLTITITLRPELLRQLSALGVERGSVLLVHTAFSKLGPVEGGPRGLIEGLLAAVGERGTLVMPSMCDDDDVPFDHARAACRGVGVVADTFWRMPGVLRSDNPHAFAAVGPLAASITRSHPIDIPHGLDSPPGRVYELDGQVLLLGVGHDADTTVHVAENLAGVRYRLPKYATVLENGRPRRYDYGETDHCCERFGLLDGWLGEKQRRAIVGRAEARLARSRDIVAAALERLLGDETVFLHPAGGPCAECNAARASLAFTKVKPQPAAGAKVASRDP